MISNISDPETIQKKIKELGETVRKKQADGTNPYQGMLRE
jgi:hypothetical protein